MAVIKKDTWNEEEVDFFDGRVIFKTRDEFPPEDIEEILWEYNIIRFDLLIEELNLYLLEVALEESQSTIYLCNQFNNIEDIVWAEPDFVKTHSSVITKFPNDALLDYQWYINRVGAPIAWGKLDGIAGNNNVIIAVLDTGIQLDG